MRGIPSKRRRNCLAVLSYFCYHLITISPQQRGGHTVRGIPSKRRRNCLAVSSYFYHHRIAICSHFTRNRRCDRVRGVPSKRRRNCFAVSSRLRDCDRGEAQCVPIKRHCNCYVVSSYFCHHLFAISPQQRGVTACEHRTRSVHNCFAVSSYLSHHLFTSSSPSDRIRGW